MKRLFALQASLGVLLFILTAVQAARVINAHLGWKLRLAGRDIAALKPDTIRCLSGIRGRVSLTYFVSSRGVMPSAMKRVEEAVRALLAAMKAEAPDHVDYRVIDPAADPGTEEDKDRGAKYAASKGASPVKVRKVLEDASSEQAVWSSLAIAHDRYPDALVQGITAADLPYLEDLIAENIKAGPNPLQPVIAVSAKGSTFTQLPALISSLTGAKVIPIDLDADPRLPPEADALFWIEPARATEEHRREIERFTASGRSVLVAGSAYAVEYAFGDAGKAAYRIRGSPCDWDALLQPLGLAMIPRLLMDKHHDPITWRSADGSEHQVDAPFQLRILPSQLDTRSLLGPPAGVLLVSGVSAIQTDPRRLGAAGLKVETVATTSEYTTALDLPAGSFDDAALAAAEPVPKQPWIVLVRHEDPWRGSLLVAGSSVLFHDDVYRQQRNANQVFLRTLLRTLTDRNRLIRARLPRTGPPVFGAVSLPARIAWRGIAVFLVPAGLMLLALRAPRKLSPGAGARRWSVRLAGGLAVFLAAGLLFSALRSRGDRGLDLTAEKMNTPSPLTSRLLDACRDGLSIEVIASDELLMPPSMKTIEHRVTSTLRGLGLRFAVTRPEDLSPGERGALRSAGIEPFEIEGVQNDVAVTVQVWSALRLRRGAGMEIVPRLDPRTVEHLEFLLAAAAKRLQTGTAPLVGVLSDLPRLSPAEAHTDYQQKGYTAPVGSDVYSFSKSLLRQHGYRVAYINPDAPVFPQGMDLLVWLQPRYPIKVLPQFGEYMARGGKAIVAVQHYNILQQQHRGPGFPTVYWPQPQFHRFNEYLELLGMRQVGDKVAEQPGEVLFDRNQGSLLLETQVNRSAFREHDPQQVARPFLIRAVAEGLEPGSVITSRLGELLFIWPSRFTFDAGKMASLGLSQEVLVSTSPATWTYAWSGGWVPEESQREPAAGLLGPQPLAAIVTGTFPRVELHKDESGRETIALAAQSAGAGGDRGELLLIGCSEMFKNAHLYSPGRQHDQFLLNATAFLAQGQEMAEIQARQRSVKGFAALPASAKISLRLVAIGLSPLLFLLYGVLRRILRRPLQISPSR